MRGADGDIGAIFFRGLRIIHVQIRFQIVFEYVFFQHSVLVVVVVIVRV